MLRKRRSPAKAARWAQWPLPPPPRQASVPAASRRASLQAHCPAGTPHDRAEWASTAVWPRRCRRLARSRARQRGTCGSSTWMAPVGRPQSRCAHALSTWLQCWQSSWQVLGCACVLGGAAGHLQATWRCSPRCSIAARKQLARRLVGQWSRQAQRALHALAATTTSGSCAVHSWQPLSCHRRLKHVRQAAASRAAQPSRRCAAAAGPGGLHISGEAVPGVPQLEEPGGPQHAHAGAACWASGGARRAEGGRVPACCTCTRSSGRQPAGQQTVHVLHRSLCW